tara:strand:+ start:17 stop:421 length:405 start_codon:yes stop_codon:yes gene_type:complete
MNQELIIKTLGKILKDVEFLMDAVINDYTPKEVVPAAYTQDFNNFYKAYGINKTKSQSFIKWKKLNNQQKSIIMDLIPLYHNAFEVKFRKYPNNFLANNCWEDYMYLLEKKQQSEKTADKVAEAQKKRLDAYNY